MDGRALLDDLLKHNQTLPNVLNTTSTLDPERFFIEPSDKSILLEAPWKRDAKYFEKVYISSLALMKMTLHAKSGKNIEVMGMMTGKIFTRSIVILDAYPLPVEGTETRVNAQAEGYEYMVQYLDSLKEVGRNENIVGWYHSHPGYGCWLSGIDVATQSLNQNFQDPYLAVVIDPTKTQMQGKVEIGAFRTYPENYIREKNMKESDPENTRDVPKEKRLDFGAHCEDYYMLDIEIFKSPNDSEILDVLNKKSWMHGLLSHVENDSKMAILNEVQTLCLKFANTDIPEVPARATQIQLLFDKVFEDTLAERLLSNSSSSNDQLKTVNDDNEDMQDESDLGEANGLDDSMDEDQEETDEVDSIANTQLTEQRNGAGGFSLGIKRSDTDGFAPSYVNRQRKIQQKSPISAPSKLGAMMYMSGRHSSEAKKHEWFKSISDFEAAGSAISAEALSEMEQSRMQRSVFGR